MNARLAPAAGPALATALVVALVGTTFWYYQNYTIDTTDPAFFVKFFAERFAWISTWVAAWSWVSHVARGQALVSQHIAVTAAAALLDLCLLIIAVPWTFFALGWPWPNGLHEISRALLVSALALVQLQMAWGWLDKRLVSLWALAASMTLALVSLNNWADRNDTDALRDLPYEVNVYPAYWVAPVQQDLDQGLDELWGKAGWGKIR